jgi:hypothetical protein
MTKKNQPVTLATLEAADETLAIIGYTVSWRLNGIQIDHATLTQQVTGAGFGAFMPAPPTARMALRRAILAWNADRVAAGHGTAISSGAAELTGSSTQAQRALIRVINSKRSSHLAFVIVAEDIDLQAFGVSYGTDVCIKLDKASGALTCVTWPKTGATQTSQDAPEIAQALQPYWAAQRDQHTSGDVSRVVRAIMGSLNTVNLREGGGYYFCPASERDGLMRLRAFVMALPVSGNHEPFMLTLPQPDVTAARRQLAQAAHAGFLDDLAAMAADLQRFLDAKPGTVKPATIAERLTAFTQLRVKAEAYADLLGMRQERITATLDALTQQAKTVLTVASAADPGGDALAAGPPAAAGPDGAVDGAEPPPAPLRFSAGPAVPGLAQAA